jgi:protein-S-isoprenylcysteine O-methyltransferase Ste14
MRSRTSFAWVVPAFFAAAAIFTVANAASAFGHAFADPSARAWLGALYGALRASVAVAFALFTVGRAVPRNPSRSPVAFVACVVAMGVIVVIGAPPANTPAALVLGGELVAVVGCVWIFASVLFLGRCFGVLPAARGLVTRGPYRTVRHPVYLGEIAALVGLVIAAPTTTNGLALLAVIVAQWVRMRLEEGALRAAFPEYERYAREVPRLLPWPRRRLVPRLTESA